MKTTYYLLVSRHSAPKVYKRYPGAEEGERVYRLNVDVPDAPKPVPYWNAPAIEVQAPEVAEAPTTEVAPLDDEEGKEE
jgi:hypothetical protein